jgi:hypothetical protein
VGCPIGKAQVSSGQSACDACKLGWVSASTGAVVCTACDAGKSVAATGQSACSDCVAGTFQSGTGQSACTFCEAGKFSSGGATGCSTCKEERYSTAGSSACDICAIGYFLDPFSDDDDTDSSSSTGACRACPTGTTCDAVGQELETMQVDAGYYRISSTAWIESEIRECLVSEACVGGTTFVNMTNMTTFVDIGDSYCGEGYEGPLCHVCSTGYFRDSATGKCEECGGESTWPGLGVLAGIIAVCVTLAIRYYCHHHCNAKAVKGEAEVGEDGTRGRHRASMAFQTAMRLHGSDMFDHAHSIHRQVSLQRAGNLLADLAVDEEALGGGEEEADDGDSGGGGGDDDGDDDDGGFFRHIKTKLRILIAFSQLVSSIGFNLTITFPSNYTHVVSALSISGLDIFQFLPMDCMMSSNYYDRLFITTVIPLVLAAALICLHIKFGRSEERQGGTNVFFLILLNLMYILLPSVSSVILMTFKCDHFQGNDTSYLQVDYRLVCAASNDKSAERLFWEAYAGIMIFVFPLGIPLAFLILLYRKRYELCPAMKGKNRWWVFTPQPGEGGGRLEEDEKRISHLEFLYQAYSPQYFWFEVVECVRRLMLSSMLILVDDGSVAQVVVAMLLSLVSVKVYGHYHPYADDDDDMLAEVAQWNLFLLLFAALLLRVDATGDDARQQQLLGWLLIFITGVAFALMLGLLLRILLQTRRPAVVPQLPAPAVGGERVGGTGGADEREVDGKGEVEIAFDGKNSVAPLEVVGEVEEEGEPERWKGDQGVAGGASSTKSMEVELSPPSELIMTVNQKKISLEKAPLFAATIELFGVSTVNALLMDPVSLNEPSLEEHFGINHASMQQLRRDIHQQQAYRDMAAFMAEAGLGAFVDVVLHGFGVRALEHLVDPEHLSDDELVNDCGMMEQDVAKFRNAIALLEECDREVWLFRLTLRRRQAHRDMAAFLTEAGLGAFVHAVIHDYGVDTFEELSDPEHLSDEELVEDCGMTEQDVARFRDAIAGGWGN